MRAVGQELLLHPAEVADGDRCIAILLQDHGQVARQIGIIFHKHQTRDAPRFSNLEALSHLQRPAVEAFLTSRAVEEKPERGENE